MIDEERGRFIAEEAKGAVVKKGAHAKGLRKEAFFFRRRKAGWTSTTRRGALELPEVVEEESVL